MTQPPDRSRSGPPPVGGPSPLAAGPGGRPVRIFAEVLPRRRLLTLLAAPAAAALALAIGPTIEQPEIVDDIVHPAPDVQTVDTAAPSPAPAASAEPRADPPTDIQSAAALPYFLGARPALRTPGLAVGTSGRGGERVLAQIDGLLNQGIAAGAFPGAVVLVGQAGRIVKHTAYGAAVTSGPHGETIEAVPTRPDTIYDLASLSKLFTATAVMQLIERGIVELDAPIRSYLPDFAGSGKERVQVRHLLTHTSGLPAGIAGNRPLVEAGANRIERLRYVLGTPLKGVPGERIVYSDVGYITLGALVEQLTGQIQAEYVDQQILRPLGMADTGYRPVPVLRERIAATLLPPPTARLRRELIHGEPHDGNAWALDGIAGHAGVFSTAPDLARFAQMIIDGGRFGDARVLQASTVARMTSPQTPPGSQSRGLGFEINVPWYMGSLAGPRAVGHTGYTGTSIVVNLERRAFAILLTNSVHPKDQNTNLLTYRKGVGQLAADALAG